MKEPKKPSPAEWRRLYQAAVAYGNMAPWEWMEDDRVFGVKNPETGEIGYCCVLGALGEVFALLVYEGREGFEGFMKLRSGEIDERSPYVAESQTALMASFEDRECLAPEDRKVITSMGLKFRGRAAWPMFRHYSPGFFPWHLTGSQARFLTLALEQALDVLPRCRKDYKLLSLPEAPEQFVRVMEDGSPSPWRDAYLPLPAPSERQSRDQGMDDILLEKVRRRAKRTENNWEIGYCYAPMPVRDRGEKPYFPRLLMALDAESGFILTVRLEGDAGHERKFPDHLLKFMEEQAFMPRSFIIGRDETRTLLEPIAARLKIAIRQQKRLPEFERAFRAMLNDFRR